MPNDIYTRIANAPVGSTIFDTLGLPRPTELDRYEKGQPLIEGTVLLGAAPGGRILGEVAKVLAEAGSSAATTPELEVREDAAKAGLDASLFNPGQPDPEAMFKALVFDASGIKDPGQLRELRAFFSPTIRRLAPSGRIIVLGTAPEDGLAVGETTAQRALEGFVRSIGKEARHGSTAQLVYVESGAEPLIGSTLRFLLSPRSAYVSGQVIRITDAKAPEQDIDWERPLEGKIALVTGAARGIGAAIASTLARDGATVIGLDVPQAGEALTETMKPLGGSELTIDITADDAPKQIADAVEKAHGGIDVVVHNAGVTRDKTLGRMTEEIWDQVLEINLLSEIRIDDELLGRELINENGRIVCVSSIAGIAGNAGQTNYATTKAGVIGMVGALHELLGSEGRTINAVAPGFIETAMTAAMPIGLREAGRRMNSLSQGGLPVDVAETIAWYASPASSGVNGNIVRVCGQSLLGA
jgi:3-oxoacyl-[acyl-carrier protein] reductase